MRSNASTQRPRGNTRSAQARRVLVRVTTLALHGTRIGLALLGLLAIVGR